MAVTKSGQVIVFGANDDAVSGQLLVQALSCDGAVTVKDGAGVVVWKTAAASSISFCPPFRFDGLEKDAGAGLLYVYLS